MSRHNEIHEEDADDGKYIEGQSFQGGRRGGGSEVGASLACIFTKLLSLLTSTQPPSALLTKTQWSD